MISRNIFVNFKIFVNNTTENEDPSSKKHHALHFEFINDFGIFTDFIMLHFLGTPFIFC